MTLKKFEVPAPDPTVEGPVFELGGEKFHCIPEAPAGVLNGMLDAVTYDASGNMVMRAPNLVAFVEGVLIDERTVASADGGLDVTEPADDVERWRALMVDKKRPIPIKVLADIVAWLTQEYTGNLRPTQ